MDTATPAAAGGYAGGGQGGGATASAAAASAKPVETPSERYLRQIRNVAVAAFIIWFAGLAIGAIVYAAVAAHDNAVQQQNACNNSGGVYVNGQCI